MMLPSPPGSAPYGIKIMYKISMPFCLTRSEHLKTTQNHFKTVATDYKSNEFSYIEKDGLQFP